MTAAKVQDSRIAATGLEKQKLSIGPKEHEQGESDWLDWLAKRLHKITRVEFLDAFPTSTSTPSSSHNAPTAQAPKITRNAFLPPRLPCHFHREPCAVVASVLSPRRSCRESKSLTLHLEISNLEYGPSFSDDLYLLSLSCLNLFFQVLVSRCLKSTVLFKARRELPDLPP